MTANDNDPRTFGLSTGSLSGEDAEGHGACAGRGVRTDHVVEDQDDAEGHGARVTHVVEEQDDTEGHMPMKKF